MRLSTFEREALKQAAQAGFVPGVVVRLFGSRVAEDLRGGDIDLLIETGMRDPAQIARAHTRFLSLVYSRLGEQKVDVLAYSAPFRTPFRSDGGQHSAVMADSVPC